MGIAISQGVFFGGGLPLIEDENNFHVFELPQLIPSSWFSIDIDPMSKNLKILLRRSSSFSAREFPKMLQTMDVQHFEIYKNMMF